MTKTHFVRTQANEFVRTEARRVTRHSAVRDADGVFRQRSATRLALEEFFSELPDAELKDGLPEEMRLQAQIEVAHIARRLAKKLRLHIGMDAVEKAVALLELEQGTSSKKPAVTWEDGPLPRDIYDAIEPRSRN